MALAKCTDEEFIRLFVEGGPAHVAYELEIDIRAVHTRRRRLERRYSTRIQCVTSRAVESRAQIPIRVKNGTVLVASDVHIWTKEETTMQRGFRKLCADMQPEIIVLNGDVFDGASISRHPSIGWEKKPTVAEELEACQDWMAKVSDACPKAKRHWHLGNHDARFETFLASNAPQMERVTGMHLKDHFPGWVPAWSSWINGNVVVKHRWKGGAHAAHNNTRDAGLSMVTSHLHSAKVAPWTDYTGTRYGVDTGTLAEPYSAQFIDYTEANPVNWRSAFAVLTFRQGVLLQPELALKYDDESMEFRGEVVKV